jgi:group II intron reverse transcriptase/maturase
MPDRLARLLSPEVMDSAWRELASDRAVWELGMPRSEMERHLLLHMLKLIEDVRARRYRPAPLRRFPIAKPDGKQRVLSALCLRDKLMQKAAQIVLEPEAEAIFHHDSFGYRPRRNVQMALARARERIACGLCWLVDADIKSFFDSIPIKPLRQRLNRFVGDRELMALVDHWLDLGVSQASFLSTPRGIAQGAILSPLFCNLYLHEFDQAMHDRKVPFVRYADDFLLFAASEQDAVRAHEYAATVLRRLDLQLNPDKTRITQAGPHVTFLGETLPAYQPAKPKPAPSNGSRAGNVAGAPKAHRRA